MVDPSTYRDLLGHFATGVTVVTVDTGERVHGMTVNSFSSVSLDPPLVQFGADVDTLTHDLVAEAGHYGVNVLRRDQEDLSNRFAGAHHDMTDPFEDIELETGPSGAPLFADALVTFDCTLEASHPAGDHTIYIGRVEAGSFIDADADPLTFYRGDYGTITEE